MKNMLFLLLIIFICSFSFTNEIVAFTTDGRLVILHEDGSWSFRAENVKYDSRLFGTWRYSEPEKTALFFFQSDGTGFMQYWNYSSKKTFTWVTEKNRIELILEDDTKESHPYKITSIKGVLSLTIDLGVAIPKEYVFSPVKTE